MHIAFIDASSTESKSVLLTRSPCFSRYLKCVKDGKEKVKTELAKAEAQYTSTLAMLETALKHSQDVKIPGRFEQEAQKFNVAESARA